MSKTKLNPKNIWSEAQNKPSLVVKDLAHLVNPNVVYEPLLRRGMFKWLAVRRDLIKLKDIWKARLKKADKQWSETRNKPSRNNYLKGYRAALRECRAEVRMLCHSDRWRAPDFDKKANQWLRWFREQNQGE